MKFFTCIKADSERLPKKNFLPVGGVPLWKRLVLTLEGQELFIDTDSPELLAELKQFSWVTAYQRLEEHSEANFYPNSPGLAMFERFVATYVTDSQEALAYVLVTSPFIKLATIQHAATFLGDFDSVVSCTEIKGFSYFQGRPINFNPKVLQKTQDLLPIQVANGAFHLITKETFLKAGHRVGSNPYFYPLSLPESLEIDYLADYNLACQLCDL